MIKWLCSYMFGGHDKCSNEIHRLKSESTERIQSLQDQIIMHLSQIQELKAVNDYQTFQLEQKIKELEIDNNALAGERNEYEQRYLRADTVASNLDEIIQRRDEEIENFNKGTQYLILKEKVSSFEDNFVKLDKYLEDLEDKHAKLLKKVTTPRYANAEGMILPLGPIVKEEDLINKDYNGNIDNSPTDKKD